MKPRPGTFVFPTDTSTCPLLDPDFDRVGTDGLADGAFIYTEEPPSGPGPGDHGQDRHHFDSADHWRYFHSDYRPRHNAALERQQRQKEREQAYERERAHEHEAEQLRHIRLDIEVEALELQIDIALWRNKLAALSSRLEYSRRLYRA